MVDTNEGRAEISLDVVGNLLSEIKAGEIDHGLSIAQMLLSEGPNFDPKLLVEIVEAIAELSVIAGSLEAKNYLKEKWPTLKKII